jgi:hypothetical protein
MANKIELPRSIRVGERHPRMNEALDLQPVPGAELQPLAGTMFNHAKKSTGLLLLLDEALFPAHRKRGPAGAAAGMRAYLKPWPAWAIRLSTEILAALWPTIAKKKIQTALELIHFFFIEWRVDGSKAFPKSLVDLCDMTLLGAVCGHTLTHIEKNLETLAEMRERR